MKNSITFTYRVINNFKNYSGGAIFHEEHIIPCEINHEEWQKKNLPMYQNGDFKLISTFCW